MKSILLLTLSLLTGSFVFSQGPRPFCDQPNIPLSDLQAIHCPALVMGGDHDVIKPEHTMAIAHNIPHSYLWILPNSGHSTPVVYSEIFDKTIDDFFSKPFHEIKGEGRFY